MMIADVGNWFMVARTLLWFVPGCYLALLYLGWAPTPYRPYRPRHGVRRSRPTWTESPLYHGLAVAAIRDAEPIAIRAGTGAKRYLDLSKLSRFTRAVSSPTRTVQIVRAATPPEETQ